MDSRILQQHFALSQPMPCPYLPGEEEQKLFTRLGGAQATAMNSALTRLGFRRSHDLAYRPVCAHCRACQPVRIPVARFQPDKSQSRCLRRNEALVIAFETAVATPEMIDLFRQYQAWRHQEGDMARMQDLEIKAMIEHGAVAHQILTARTGDGALVAAMLVDWLEDGASAVYSWYHPETPQRGLGNFMILALVAQMKRMGKPFVYLGYYIPGSVKMAYKARFRPLERFDSDTALWGEMV